MTVEKTASPLAAALAAFQRSLPKVSKGNTANTGTFSYTYADLADVSNTVLPLLGAQGLSWITRPTVVDGRFVLAYELLHTSGEKREGEYPLAGNTAQQVGSAITYARRYALCSVTGVAPEGTDDDGAHASQHRNDWDTAQPSDGTVDQFGIRDAFAEEIANAKAEDFADIGRRVKLAKHQRDITAAMYDELDIAAGRRLAELRQEAGGAA